MSQSASRPSLVRPLFVSVAFSLFAGPTVACVNHVKEALPKGPGKDATRSLSAQALPVREAFETPLIVPPDTASDDARPDFAREAKRHAAFLSHVRDFEARGTKEADFAATINYSAALLHLGRPERAIEVLTALEAKHPGAYETAANLGTAYELAGKLEDAATWIAKGMERNPASHDGTEWLHLAILRAKLKLRDDPNWLARHSVLDGAGDRNAAEIVRAIEYQLRERLQFVRPTDATVCDLFYQAALRVEGENASGRRTHYLRESLRFGPWRKAEAEQRLKS